MAMVRWVGRQLSRMLDALRQTEHVYLVVVSVVIGLLGGLSAVGFRLLIQTLNRVAWHEGQYTLDYIAALPPWWKIIVPAAGGLLVGLITFYFAKEAKGHGVPEVMESVALKGGRIRPRVVIAKMFASGVSIGSGGSVGREGPIVQIGSALGSSIGQWLRVDEDKLRTLVSCGAAAGIAGTFNAPVAGALFAVEIILGDFGVAQFSPIVISSVAGTVVSQHFLGDFPAFVVPAYRLVHPGELFAYTVLGAAAGLTAVAFIKTLYAAEDVFDRLTWYPPLKGVLGGAAVGAIGIALPHVYGVGYEAINEALNGNMLWYVMLALVAAKLIAVSLTIGSGGSGGIFAPSLFIGAMLGGAVGTIVHGLWPETTAGPGAYALVGMGGVVAASTHAPITAILIIFELTGEYPIILPLMICCIVGTLVSTRLEQSSIYTLKLLRRGVDLRRGKALNVLESVPVRDQMRTDVVTVRPDSSLLTLITAFIEHAADTVFVTDEQGHFQGAVTMDEIRPIIGNAALLNSFVIAQDVLVATDVPAVSPDDSLSDVMKLFGHSRRELGVVDEGRLVGAMSPQDVIARYNVELFKRDMVAGMASTLAKPLGRYLAPAAGETAVAEIPVLEAWVGRTVRDLDIRNRFGVSVLMVKQAGTDGRSHLQSAAQPDYAFRPGDVALLLGPRDEIRRIVWSSRRSE